jgi:hypothetical protein
MCVIAKFLLYSSSTFDIVMINDKSTHLFVELLVFYAHMLGCVMEHLKCLHEFCLEVYPAAN